MGSAEYVLVFVAIVLGLALTDVLVSLHKLLRARGRVRWDWAAPACAFIAVMLLLMIWWSQFPKSPDAHLHMTIGQFLPLFVALVLLFLLASAALPDEVPAEGVDLKAYYERNRPYFWTLLTLDMGWTMGTELWPRIADGGDPVGLVLDRSADVVFLALFASLIFVRWRWWNAIVIVVAMLGPIGWLSKSIG